MLPTLSRLSVREAPAGRLRRRCSSRYLRISPLHLEFHLPLTLSRCAVLGAVPELSPGLSPPADTSAYTPFTPSKSEQRLHPPSYRGCWHGVSRCLFLRYRLTSSLRKELYDPKAFFTHAALLRQAFAHCAKFPTAASRRSLDRVSVPVWRIILSDPLDIAALVSRYLTNKLMSRRPLFQQQAFQPPGMPL